MRIGGAIQIPVFVSCGGFAGGIYRIAGPGDAPVELPVAGGEVAPPAGVGLCVGTGVAVAVAELPGAGVVDGVAVAAGVGVGVVFVPPVGVAVGDEPGAGVELEPGAGVGVAPGLGVELVPGAGVGVAPGLGVDPSLAPVWGNEPIVLPPEQPASEKLAASEKASAALVRAEFTNMLPGA